MLVLEGQEKEFLEVLGTVEEVLDLRVNVKKCALVGLAGGHNYLPANWIYRGVDGVDQQFELLKPGELYKYLGTWVPWDLNPVNTFDEIRKEVRGKLNWADQFELDLFLRSKLINLMVTPVLWHRCYGLSVETLGPLVQDLEGMIQTFLMQASAKPTL